MMTTSKGWFTFSVCALVLAPSALLGTTFQFQVTPESVLPGNRARLEIRLGFSPEDLARNGENTPVMRDEMLTSTERFVLLDHGMHKDKDAWVWSYEMTQYQPGTFTIPPVEIAWGAETFSTESKEVTVTGSRAEGDSELRSEFGALPIPLRIFYWLKWVLLAMGLGFATRYAYRKFPRHWLKKKHFVPPSPTIPEENATDWLRRQLARLREEVRIANPGDGLVDDLALVLRTYFEKATRKPARRWTTTELETHLPSELFAEPVKKVFEDCDRFRFSGKQFAPLIEFVTQKLDIAERSLLPC